MTDNVESRKRARDNDDSDGEADKPYLTIDIDKKKKSGKQYKWELTEYHMTYSGWVALEKLKAAVVSTFPLSTLVAYSMVHEESDKKNPYKHTHFYFKVKGKSQRCGSRLMDIDGVHPHAAHIEDSRHRKAIIGKYHFKSHVPVQAGLEDLLSPGEREQERYSKIRDLAVKGDLTPVLDEYPSECIRHLRSLRDIALHRGAEPPKLAALESTSFYWLYGAPNTGKSTTALKMCQETYPDEYPYVMPSSCGFVQGYRFQKAFIIEEASPESCRGRATFYKTLMDVFPTQVDVKNSYQVIRPEMVIVTSNYHPRDCFNPRDAEAILSRVQVVCCKTVYPGKKKFNIAHASLMAEKFGFVYE